jgi:hypothetical protein
MPLLMDFLERLTNKASDVLLIHPEILSTYIETLNVVSKFALSCPELAVALPSPDMRNRIDTLVSSTADASLLRLQVATWRIFQLSSGGDLQGLKETAVEMAISSSNTALAVLEALPNASESIPSVRVATALSELHILICLKVRAPEPRALAVQSLAEAMDYLLSSGNVAMLPDNNALGELWQSLGSAPTNPSLSNSIIRASGPILATITLRGSVSGIAEWGAMMTDAVRDDKVRWPSPSGLLSSKIDIGRISTPASPSPCR